MRIVISNKVMNKEVTRQFGVDAYISAVVQFINELALHVRV